jgi:hypothetical protein
MHLLFLDESGTPPPPGRYRDKYFVVGGLIIPDGIWHKVHDQLHGMKVRRKLFGELKWRYFSPSNEQDENPMKGKDPQERNEIRAEMYQIICSNKAIRTLACVTCIRPAYELPSVTSAEDLYHYTYKPISERFQYHLQDVSKVVGRKETGIIVVDHRAADQDYRLRQAHERLTKTDGLFTANYRNLVESLFFLPSHISVGVQLADIVAGAVWRKFEKNDDSYYKMFEPSLRRSASGVVEGYGIVKAPKYNWS